MRCAKAVLKKNEKMGCKTRVENSRTTNQTQSLTHHNATLSMSPSPTLGFGDAGAGIEGGAAAAWAA